MLSLMPNVINAECHKYTLCVIMLKVVMLSAVTLSIAVLNVTARLEILILMDNLKLHGPFSSAFFFKG
jgi:hypothetical protein